MAGWKDQIGKVEEITFPEGKPFYVELFLDLIVENSPEYEYFELYMLVDSLNWDNDMQGRYNTLSTFVYQKLLDLGIMEKGHQYELRLTDYGIEVKNSGKKLSEYLKEKKNNSNQKHNNIHVYGDVKNLIQDSEVNAKHIGDKIENGGKEKSWWNEFSNQLLVGIIILALTLLAAYFGWKT